MAEALVPSPIFTAYLESPEIAIIKGDAERSGFKQEIVEQDEDERYIKLEFGPSHIHEAFLDYSGNLSASRDKHLRKHPSNPTVVVKSMGEIPIEIHEEFGPSLRFYIYNQSPTRQELVTVGFSYGRLNSVIIRPARIPELPPIEGAEEEVNFYKQSGKWYYRLLNIGSMIAKTVPFSETIVSPKSQFSYQLDYDTKVGFQLISKQPSTQISITMPETVDTKLWHQLLWTEGKDWLDLIRLMPVHIQVRVSQKANPRRR